MFKRQRPVSFDAGLYNPGDDLLSPRRTTIGRTSLASVFGTRTGVFLLTYSHTLAQQHAIGKSHLPNSVLHRI
jgi:hypothetical protein